MDHPKSLLERHHIDPKKSLGQNFLWDDNLLARIVEAGEVTAADAVLEIGPGVGALTHHLAQAAGRVVAVELDNRLMPLLRRELAPFPHVELVHGDILEQDLDALFGDQPYKIIANVPYYITGAILRQALAARNKPVLMVLTVQKEVAERISAEPPHMSLLSVTTQFYGATRLVHVLKAGAFWPRPEVDSAIVTIDLRARAGVDSADEALFLRLVKAGFAQKRKQLHKNLRALNWSRETIDGVLAQAGVDGTRRAETLALTEWAALTAAAQTIARP